jgi:hypothetical protein
MSSALLNYKPTLNYIGAVDITSAQYGSTMYSVFYDSAIVSLGNVLMFEYKLIKEDITIPSPANVTLGFVSIENATNSGIANQWTIAIPALDDNYDPTISVKIAIRVYVGLFTSPEVGVTEWSEPLEVHNPPNEPFIYRAYYDTPSVDADDLYLFLSPDSKIDYDIVNFVAAFYYQNQNGTTIWDVSEPVKATLVNVSGDYNGKYMVHIPNFGKVSTNLGEKVVYVAAYAVYQYKDLSENNFYSVSHVSNTYTAPATSDNASPTITGINYSMYNEDPTQNMTVNWNAPNNSGIPTFHVDYYNLYKSTDGITWSEVATDISENVLSYNVDVSSYSCNTKIYFQLNCVSTNGTISPASPTTVYSSLNIFKYSHAPENLLITDTSFDPDTGLVNMRINFDRPTDRGCGDEIKFAIIVTDLSNNSVTNYMTYDGSEYAFNFSDDGVGQTGSVKIYLITEDTNPSVPGGSIYPDRIGASASIPYIALNFLCNPVVYKVYDEPVGSQNMYLSWDVQDTGDWILKDNGFKIFYKVNDETWESHATTDEYYYIFDAAAVGVDDCSNTLHFYSESTFVNGDVEYQSNSSIESINVFKYATAPQNLVIENTTFNPNTKLVTMDIKFDKPLSNGCGVPKKFAIIVTGDDDIALTNEVTYDATKTSYTYNFSSSSTQFDQTGSVKVYLITEDTNPSEPGGSEKLLRDGASNTTPYIAIKFVLEPVDYQVYVDPVGSQDMKLSWNNQVAGDWELADNGYKVYYKVNSDDVWSVYNTTEDLLITFDAAARGVDICGDTIHFYTEATLVNGDVNYIAESNIESINVFKYATAPQNFVIENTTFNPSNSLVTMDIKFDKPLSNGCGIPKKFAIIVTGDDDIKLTNYVTYDATKTSYTYEFSSFSTQFDQTGSVEVYLMTEDTNPSEPGGSEKLLRDGASISTPYIAIKFVLEPVDYQVYVDPVGSQDMKLSWNNQVAGDWELADNGYKVYYKVTNLSDVSGVWTLYDETEDLLMTFDAATKSVDDCGNTIHFYTEATLVNGDVEYIAESNIESINVFKYATAPQNLVITNTAFNPSNSLVTMSINFEKPLSNGCGRPDQFAVIVTDREGNDAITDYVTYNPTKTSYRYDFYNSPFEQTGLVKVYLITEDTNPSEPGGSEKLLRDGASNTTPFIAIKFVLEPVDYQVYVDPVGSQNMNLSWNNQVAGDWELADNGYKVYYKVNSDDVWSVYNTTEDLLMTFDAAARGVDICGDTIHFYTEATLVNGDVEYQANSSIESINVFKYATAPQNLVIENTTFNPNTNLVTMNIKFDKPLSNGCGVPKKFAIIVTGDDDIALTNEVTYDATKTSYTYNFSSSSTQFDQTGSVEVYLITEDTNPSEPGGSEKLLRDGASISTPYIAINFVLEPVDYQVYVEPVGSQNMNLSWNSQVAGDWSLADNGYKVYYKVNSDDVWSVYNANNNNVRTFNAATQGVDKCGDTIHFYTEATLVNGDVNYIAESNIESINVFKYATAPQSVQVLWSSSDIDESYMDIRMQFSNPASNGCGNVIRFVVNVEDASGNILNTKNITYVSGQSTPYEVNFDNVLFSLFGNVVVYMITVDTNGAGNLNGARGTAPFIADRLPIYKNVVMNGARNLLTFDVITQTELAPVAGVATVSHSTIIPYQWLTDASTDYVTVIKTYPLANNEYKYSFTMLPGIIGASNFPTPFGIVVANTVGIQEQNADA